MRVTVPVLLPTCCPVCWIMVLAAVSCKNCQLCSVVTWKLPLGVGKTDCLYRVCSHPYRCLTMTSTIVPPGPSTALFSSKKHPTILPNAHPYAIKTTSSALLSRSNSSPHSASVKHHYVPPSPTRPRHRHTSSASSIERVSINKITQPPPLPVPLSFPSVSPTRASFTLVNDATPRRPRRAETLPPTAAVPVFYDNTVAEDNKLPRNPKQWSADDLASYIATSIQAGNELSVEDQGCLLHVIKEQPLLGRDFLRLTDADLTR
jgi:hypothetical protein